MKKIALALAAFALSSPAFADDAAPNDTIALMIANGSVVTAQGQDYEMVYAADGTFTGGDGALAGTWNAKGDQHCITIPGMFDNMCSAYPAGKTTGDKFDIESEMGPLTVTLK